MKENQLLESQSTLFGHPTGLFVLFFAELWERFSYYGMRALLVFYMIKGFMGCNDVIAYKIYGAYTALVYMTPFFGGMIADRIIGARRAVILGGLFMAAGHLLMGVDKDWTLLGLTFSAKTSFFVALALLIVGNGFFKPNISTIVGSLYPHNSRKRDGGFTIFYIGINLGAAIAPLLCGYIGETYGWHKGFGLATIGMLTGLAVFIAPTLISQVLLLISCLAASVNIAGIEATGRALGLTPGGDWGQYDSWLNTLVTVCMILAGVLSFWSLNRRQANQLAAPPSRLADLMTAVLIMAGAIGFSWAMFQFHPEEIFTKSLFYLLAIILLAAAVVSSLAVMKSGLPVWAGMPADFDRMRQGWLGIGKDWWVYLGAIASVPVFMVLVSGFETFFQELPGGIRLIPQEIVDRFENSTTPGMGVVGAVVSKASTPAGLVLVLAGLFAVGYLVLQMFTLSKIPRERMYVVMILTFFSVLFWSFFEQAGSSLNNFTDRNIQRVTASERTIGQSELGQTLQLRIPLVVAGSELPELNQLPVLTQEFLGRTNDDPGMQGLIARAISSIEGNKTNGKTGESLQSLIQSCQTGPLNFTTLNYLREYSRTDNPAARNDLTLNWKVAEDNLGMAVGGTEIPASVFQALNPLFILIFGLLFTLGWSWMANRGIEPSTATKFAWGLIQLGLGFGCFWLGAQNSTGEGLVWVGWLVLGYLLHTTGELCLSPVGLSMVTKLSPARLVSTVMGTWFLATAFAQFLAAIIASFTSAKADEGAEEIIPIPAKTVGLYQDVFLFITIAAVVSGVICLALSPLLKIWMHEEELDDSE
jgi:dipeptide/tripeptide permease